jgi:hypothetical protein
MKELQHEVVNFAVPFFSEMQVDVDLKVQADC